MDERISMEGSIEYLLVLSFAPGGSLTEFLRTHIIDWNTFCKMSLSVVKGLAYLHTDIRKGGMYCICPETKIFKIFFIYYFFIKLYKWIF